MTTVFAFSKMKSVGCLRLKEINDEIGDLQQKMIAGHAGFWHPIVSKERQLKIKRLQEESEEIRREGCPLYHGCSLSIVRPENSVVDLNAEISDLKKQQAFWKDEAAKVTKESEKHQLRATELTHQLEHTKRSNMQKAGQLGMLAMDNAKLKAELAEKNKKIAELEQQVAELKEKNSNDLKEKQEGLIMLKLQLDDLQSLLETDPQKDAMTQTLPEPVVCLTNEPKITNLAENDENAPENLQQEDEADFKYKKELDELDEYLAGLKKMMYDSTELQSNLRDEPKSQQEQASDEHQNKEELDKQEVAPNNEKLLQLLKTKNEEIQDLTEKVSDFEEKSENLQKLVENVEAGQIKWEKKMMEMLEEKKTENEQKLEKLLAEKEEKVQSSLNVIIALSSEMSSKSKKIKELEEKVNKYEKAFEGFQDYMKKMNIRND